MNRRSAFKIKFYMDGEPIFKEKDNEIESISRKFRNFIKKKLR